MKPTRKQDPEDLRTANYYDRLSHEESDLLDSEDDDDDSAQSQFGGGSKFILPVSETYRLSSRVGNKKILIHPRKNKVRLSLQQGVDNERFKHKLRGLKLDRRLPFKTRYYDFSRPNRETRKKYYRIGRDLKNNRPKAELLKSTLLYCLIRTDWVPEALLDYLIVSTKGFAIIIRRIPDYLLTTVLRMLQFCQSTCEKQCRLSFRMKRRK
jgi:hypothetical protein